MSIENRVTSATRKSIKAQQVAELLTGWIKKNILTEKRKKEDVDHHFMSLEEWQDFLLDRLKLAEFSDHVAFQRAPFEQLMAGVTRKLFGLEIWEWQDANTRAEVLERWLNKMFNQHGWFVASRSSKYVLEALKYQEQVTPPPKLYHFSPFYNKDRIVRKGLIPKGTNDGRHSDFKYPPRVFLLKEMDMPMIRELAYHIFNQDIGIEKLYYGGADMNMPLVIFEINVASCRPGTKFFQDSAEENAVWTYTHIPPAALKIVHEDESPDE
jgi:hypothetical protein